MSSNTTSIRMTWDRNGRIEYELSGVGLAPPRDDPDLWLLAPSGPFFLFNQLGVLRPSYGLILCSQTIDMCLHENYVLSPINTTLKSARLEYEYLPGKGLTVRYYPAHALLHNNDSLEEGTRQLVANNFYTVVHRIPEFHRFEPQLIAGLVISQYLDFLSGQMTKGQIGPDRDCWNIQFSQWFAEGIRIVSAKYSVYESPDSGDTSWRATQRDGLNRMCSDLLSKHATICRRMGIG